MSEDVLKHIFDPFYTTKPVGRGTGLGLSLAWEIMQRHDGGLQVKSTPGVGSTFRVILPVSKKVDDV
jgi:signal transduction histidine kinase